MLAKDRNRYLISLTRDFFADLLLAFCPFPLSAFSKSSPFLTPFLWLVVFASVRSFSLFAVSSVFKSLPARASSPCFNAFSVSKFFLRSPPVGLTGLVVEGSSRDSEDSVSRLTRLLELLTSGSVASVRERLGEVEPLISRSSKLVAGSELVLVNESRVSSGEHTFQIDGCGFRLGSTGIDTLWSGGLASGLDRHDDE